MNRANVFIGPVLSFSIAILSVTVCNTNQAKAGANNNTLLILGDSLSAGYGVPSANSWVQLLQKRIQDSASDIHIINASISGETTVGGRNRLSSLLTQHNPRWLMLELGANDGLQGLPIKNMRSNLKTMIEMAQAQGVGVILVGMKLPPNYGKSYTSAFADTYPALAKQYNTAIVPFLLDGIASDFDKMQADGIHPNLQAQPQLLDNVWPVLQTVLFKAAKN